MKRMKLSELTDRTLSEFDLLSVRITTLRTMNGINNKSIIIFIQQ